VRRSKVDEFAAVLRARRLAAAVHAPSPPVDVQLYVDHQKAVLRVLDLPGDQPGYSTPIANHLCIFVNASDSVERRRFTICHELAHSVLNLPSEHSDTSELDYAGRPLNEILCDVFAAELLLPYTQFKPFVDACDIGFADIDELAARFQISVTSTGSRFAAATDLPCAFVLSQAGIVRYASRSKALREAGAWISVGSSVPTSSSTRTARIQGGQQSSDISADVWFSDWKRGGTLIEESRCLPKWDQCLTLIWFDDDEVPEPGLPDDDDGEEPLLKELDGVLPWPVKSRRRR
jgi:Zn-dependent peptidase ImmA (M78 family)